MPLHDVCRRSDGKSLRQCHRAASRFAGLGTLPFFGSVEAFNTPARGSPPALVLTPPHRSMKFTLITKSLKLSLQTTPAKPTRKKQREGKGDGTTSRQGKVLAGIGKVFWRLMVKVGEVLIKVVVESWWKSAGS